MAFQAPKLTNAGKALYYENMAGEKITITTIKMGSGTLSGPIANLTDLVEPVVVIDAFAVVREGYVDVSGTFSNADLEQGFYWREIGVFAADPDDPENREADILYCYQNAYDTADYIPVASVETVEKNIAVPIIVGDAEAVSCTLDRSLVNITMKDLDDHDNDPNSHKNKFGEKQDKIENLAEKNTIVDTDSIAIVDSADSSKTKRVLWSTIKSTLEKVFTPNTRKINNKDLSKDLTLTGEDINVSKSDSTTIKTALSNKADKVEPERYDFPFDEGFQAYQPCKYWKNEFDEATIQIGAMKNNVLIPAGKNVVIGNMPVGFRPNQQIYFPAVSDLLSCTGFINDAGTVSISCKENIESGSVFTAFTISYLAE